VTEVPTMRLQSAAVMDSYLRYVNMAPIPGLRALIEVSRDLLRRTAELPETEQGLLGVLAEYRYAVYAFAALADALPVVPAAGRTGASVVTPAES
jgi:hypothetical protein